MNRFSKRPAGNGSIHLIAGREGRAGLLRLACGRRVEVKAPGLYMDGRHEEFRCSDVLAEATCKACMRRANAQNPLQL